MNKWLQTGFSLSPLDLQTRFFCPYEEFFGQSLHVCHLSLEKKWVWLPQFAESTLNVTMPPSANELFIYLFRLWNLPSSSTNDLRDTPIIHHFRKPLHRTLLLSIKAHCQIPTLIKSTGKVTDLNYGVNFVSLHLDALSPFILIFLSYCD